VRKRGFIYWANLDKRRPALVISIDARNERANDVIVIPCSTRLLASVTHVTLARGEGGVPSPCVLKCEQIATAHQFDVDAVPLGPALSAPRLREVERAVARAIGVPA
jgi:mRNA-degrading endonuclease toxin of MazEF toxin-antitoxin module